MATQRIYAYLFLIFCSTVASQTSAASLEILYAGNLDGELEPCGCTAAGDMGGIRRQLTVIKELRTSNPELVAISSGGLLSSEQSTDEIRNRFILSGTSTLQFDAIGLQWADLAYGTDWLTKISLPWTAANWRDPAIPASRAITRGTVKLRYFQWLDPNSSPHVQMARTEQPVISTPAPLITALEKAKDSGEIIVLGTTLTEVELRDLLPTKLLDIVLLRSNYEEIGSPHRVNGTLYLQPGSRGMRFGLVRLEIEGNTTIRSWRHRTIEMPKSVADAAELDGWYANYNEEVKQAYLQRVALRTKQESGTSNFAGVENCRSCHAEITKLWETTPHAGAFTKLENVGKAFDPNCLKCHTVGMGKPGGFLDRDVSEHLINVQCESCHGPGRDHIKSEGRNPMSNSSAAAVIACFTCHNRAHSPLFDFAAYWPRIQHALPQKQVE